MAKRQTVKESAQVEAKAQALGVDLGKFDIETAVSFVGMLLEMFRKRPQAAAAQGAARYAAAQDAHHEAASFALESVRINLEAAASLSDEGWQAGDPAH